MKKLILMLTAIVFAAAMPPVLTAGYDGRLDGFSGEYFVQDDDFDVLQINPAFVMRMDYLMLIDDNAFSADYESYKNVNGVVNAGTNVESEMGGSTFDMTLAPRIGILGRLSDSLGLGIIYEPMIVKYDDKNYVNHDVTKAWSYTEIGDYNRRLTAGLFNLTGLAGLRLGAFDFAAVAKYWNNPRNGEMVFSTTNGVVDPSTRTKTRLDDNGLGIRLGVLHNGDGLEWGASALFESAMVASGGGFYDNAADVFWAQDETAITKAGLNLHCQKKLTDVWDLRLILSPSFSSGAESIVYDRANYDLAFGAGTYAASGLADQVDDTVENLTSVTLHASLLDTKVCTGEVCLPFSTSTRFAGLTLGYTMDVTTYSHDDDKTAAATGSGQEFEQVTRTATPVSLGYAMGFENLFGEKFFLRGGFDATLFRLTTTEFKETDKWDASAGSLKDTVTSWTRSVDAFFLSSLVLTSGVGYKASDRLLFDMGISVQLIGLNLNTSKSDPNLLPDVKHAPVNTTLDFDIELNFSVSYKL